MVRRRKYHVTHESELDKFLSWIEHLADASKTRIVLVEHKRDGEYLEHFGVQNVIWWQEGKPEDQIIRELMEKDKEIILLFDQSKQSNKHYEQVKAMLEQNGVKVNPRFRKILLASEIRELGGIIKYLKKHVNITPRKEIGGTFFQEKA